MSAMKCKFNGENPEHANALEHLEKAVATLAGILTLHNADPSLVKKAQDNIAFWQGEVDRETTPYPKG